MCVSVVKLCDQTCSSCWPEWCGAVACGVRGGRGCRVEAGSRGWLENCAVHASWTWSCRETWVLGQGPLDGGAAPRTLDQHAAAGRAPVLGTRWRSCFRGDLTKRCVCSVKYRGVCRYVSCQEALCVCSERRESASSAVRVRAVSVLLVISEYTRECFVSVICLCVRSSIHRERPTRVSAACVS